MSDITIADLKTYGFSYDAFCHAALIAADASRSEMSRSVALCFMGLVARYSEPDLSMGNGGYSFFLASVGISNNNVKSSFEIITLFKEKPDGHDDQEVAVDSIKNILSNFNCVNQEDAELYAERLIGMSAIAGQLPGFTELRAKVIAKSKRV